MKSKINILDLLIFLSILFSTTGFILAKAEKSSLNKIIEGKEKIAIVIHLPDVNSKKDSLFKIGDKSAITIRNRPYTQLDIIKVEIVNKQLVLPDNLGKYKLIDDPNRESIKDYIITLSDTALKTNDGYAVGGNKIKIGNIVELEGFNYRLSGKVIDIYE